MIHEDIFIIISRFQVEDLYLVEVFFPEKTPTW